MSAYGKVLMGEFIATMIFGLLAFYVPVLTALVVIMIAAMFLLLCAGPIVAIISAIVKAFKD